MGHRKAPGRPSRPLFSRHVLASAVARLAFGGVLAWPLMTVPLAAHAQSAAVRLYDIPAGALEEALNRFGRDAGIMLSFPSDATAGLRSAGLQGHHTVRGGMQVLIEGSGLQAQEQPNGSFVLKKLAAPVSVSTGEAMLPMVTVKASAEPGRSELPAVYAGGQVARGAQLGVLGNVQVMESPFNITSYTAQTITDQQARSIAEVISRNDPSVRVDFGEGTSVDGLLIRGFAVGEDQTSLNGLPGILPQYRITPEFVERAEVLKGPSALLNGMSPGGAVGGTVNIVSKRATDAPITRVTLGHVSSSMGSVHADVGRRFGQDNAFGIRVNASAREGDTARDDLTDKARMASVGLDYRSDHLRASFDVLHQTQKMRGARGSISLAGLTGPAPSAPDGELNFAQPWAYQDSRDTTVMARLEYDLSARLSVFAAIGHSKDKTLFLGANPTLVNEEGDYTTSNIPVDWRQKTTASQLGLRGSFNTGDVRHQWSLSASHVRRDSDFLFYFGGLTGGNTQSNIYDPVAAPRPVINDPMGDPYPWLTQTRLPSYALTDTLYLAQDRVQLTFGLRQQGVKSGAYDESALSPLAAIVYKPWRHVSLYANHIQGLTMGDSVMGSNNQLSVFPPYKSKQLEGGIKLDLGRITGTLSVFQIAKPSGAADPATGVFGVIGEQRNRGLELNVFGEVAPHVRLLGGASLVDAELTRTAGGVNEGKRPVGAATRLVNLGAEWDVPVPGVTLVSRVVYTGSTYADAANLVRVPGWRVFDLGARYATRLGGQSLTLRATVENAFDKRYWRQGEYYATLGMPRTLVMSATMDF